MKTNQELYNERLNRLKTAIALGKPDRVPISTSTEITGAVFEGLKLSEFMTNPVYAHKKSLEGTIKLGDVDVVQLPFNYPPVLGPAWLSDMKLPGRELRDDELWQIDEQGYMTVEDYGAICENGWNRFFGEYCTKRLRDKNVMGYLQKASEIAPQIIQDVVDAGLVPLTGGIMALAPVESFCAGRTITQFIKDLYKVPGKVQAAMDAAMVDILENLRQQIRILKPLSVFVGGARGASEFLSPRFWERFNYNYMRKIAEVIIEEGSFVYFHLDGNWERDLAFFHDLPKGKCIIGVDGFTDIFKVKETLGDHFCIFGDVPPSLLTLGTPDEVYNYSSRLVKEIGPSGFILAPGCTAPPNAKIENIKAMISAATGK